MPYDTKLYYFDMAYNLGTSRAIKIMQQCAGVTSDGIIGAVTISKMNNVTKICLKQKRESFYNSLVSLKKFLNGWLNRARDIYKRSL